MSKRFYNLFKNSKLKGIFFFLLLATVFWVLTKFSKQYTATATATIHYLNIPEATQIRDDNLKKIDFNLTTSGFEFLYYRFKNPIVDIDLKNFYIAGKKKVIIPKVELMGLVSSQLNNNLTIRNLPNDEFVVSLDAIIFKIIPVIVKTKFTYKDGFRSLDTLRVEPDSVVVTGPLFYLNEMNFIESILISQDDIDKTFTQSVSLIGHENKKVSIDPMEVNVSVNVAEFTQKKMVVPIELENAPQGTIVKLIPTTVAVTFNVSVEDFNGITASDFKLVCDFNDRNLDEDFILLKLEEGPPRIYNIEFSTKKIDYLIFK
ncbi:MAG: hypothetical protein ACI83B_003946 [Sediminicola sp.]|jgi:hypothetical protein|tara:strand:+ start:1094 stop:2044 length:951 start_codon:yes stop_codon:yes gene_type:complete